MNELDTLQGRITAALDRIARGVETLDAPLPPEDVAPEPEIDAEEVARLRDALEDERRAKSGLEERLREFRERGEREMAELREQVAASREALAQLDGDLGRMRRAYETLRDTNEDLTRALSEDLGDPHLINQAMQAELEAMRAARATERAECAAILAALDPLLAEAAIEAQSVTTHANEEEA
ncbi:hypothetical protein OCH239_21740 [Roseivivax halodurans JCM 10272]|uniref:Uncharacterized protein n=1 Tax=Roseivivax halodurans JCM 10272 TaxID=1449350 RepID=X7EEV5_9RHOB|nr:hypothetical protein [Roseivivax halodurans]ETX14629.1 hypothetical protein OCH239_21740 [Roseivivax halodurans JCM 10272]